MNQEKKKRIHRSPEVIVELILEAERIGNAAEVCRREGINPVQFYRWKERFKKGAVEGRRRSYKKAIVTLKEGKIDFYENI